MSTAEPAQTPEPGQAPEPAAGPEPVTALAAAVALLALAGIGALLADHLLSGALRLAAGALAGAGLGAAALAVTGARGRPRRSLAAAVAGAAALALTVPAVLATRPPALADLAAVRIAALAEGDRVHSLPDPAAPVLVRRAAGDAELLDATGVRRLDAAPADLVALSADGARLVHVRDGATTVLPADSAGAPPPAGADPAVTLDGVPVALDGHRIVLRRCAGELCELSGVDLTAPDRALWTLGDTAAARGIDPAGIEVPARPDRPPGPLDAARATGVLPAVPLRFDPAQGWIQLDAATGFPVGRILAAPEDPCRITVTGEPPRALDPLQPVPLVLTVCSAPDGALRAAAFRAGERLWQSQASPGGDWSVRLDQGRVLATGTEAGTATVGEIVASEHRAAWTAPGADQGAWASTFTARLGIDGARMIVTNQAGQLVAYDTADGADAWTLPLPTDAGVRGSLAAGTAVVLDPAARQRPLAPRGAQRLRVIDADRGAVVVETVLADQVDAVHPVGGGRALVTADGHSLLLGP